MMRYWLGMLVAAGLVLGACDGGDGTDDTEGTRDTVVDSATPADATPKDAPGSLCDDFCAQIDECELSIPGCLHRCGSYDREVRSCVVEASNCEAARTCFGTPPPSDAGNAVDNADTADASPTDDADSSD